MVVKETAQYDVWPGCAALILLQCSHWKEFYFLLRFDSKFVSVEIFSFFFSNENMSEILKVMHYKEYFCVNFSHIALSRILQSA